MNSFEALTQVGSELDEASIAYAVLGDSRDYGSAVSGDIDIVVRPSDLLRISSVLQSFCRRSGFVLVQEIVHEIDASFLVFCRVTDGEAPRFLKLDFCGDYRRDGRLLLTAEYLLKGAREARSQTGEALGFQVPAPHVAFAYYILKRIDKADLTDVNGDYLSDIWAADPGGCHNCIRGFWPERHTIQIAEAATNNVWSQVRQDLPELRRRLRVRATRSITDIRREVWRSVRRVLRPTGMWIAVSGPEWSSRATTVRDIADVLSPAFRRVRRLPARPALVWVSALRSEQTQGPQPTKSWTRSTIELLACLFDYTCGYLFVIWPALVRSTLVMCDGYYPDLLVDPRRFRYGGSLALARLVGAIVPSPDLTIVLDVRSESIRGSHAAVDPAEMARQRAAYQGLTRQWPRVLLVADTVGSPDVAQRAVAHAVEVLSRRTRRRKGWPTA